jgi:hypothetical protein
VTVDSVAVVMLECKKCGRAMAPQPVQMCGKCRGALTVEERAVLVPPRELGSDSFVVALIRDGGAFVLAEMSMPEEVLRQHVTKLHERELRPLVVPRLGDLAEAWAEGIPER